MNFVVMISSGDKKTEIIVLTFSKDVDVEDLRAQANASMHASSSSSSSSWRRRKQASKASVSEK